MYDGLPATTKRTNSTPALKTQFPSKMEVLGEFCKTRDGKVTLYECKSVSGNAAYPKDQRFVMTAAQMHNVYAQTP